MPEVKGKSKIIKGESLEDLRKAVSEIKQAKESEQDSRVVSESSQDSVQDQFIPKETVKAASEFQSSTFVNKPTMSPKDLALKDKLKKFFKKNDVYADIESGEYIFKVKNLDAIHLLEGDLDQITIDDADPSRIKALYRKTFGYFVRSLVSMTDTGTGDTVLVEDMVGSNVGDPDFYKKLETFIIESISVKLILEIITKYSDFFSTTSGGADQGEKEGESSIMPEKKS